MVGSERERESGRERVRDKQREEEEDIVHLWTCSRLSLLGRLGGLGGQPGRERVDHLVNGHAISGIKVPKS